MKNILMILAITVLFSSYANATVSKKGTVTQVKMFGSVFLIYMDELPGACSGGHKRVAIKSDHPIFSAVVASTLTAMTTGSTVVVNYKEVCTHNSLAWDFNNLTVVP